MAGVVGSGRQSLMQPNPYNGAAPPVVAGAKRLVVPQSGVIITVADLLTSLEFANADFISVYLWPFVFTDATATATVAAYTTAPYLWTCAYRQSQTAFVAGDIKVPTWPPNSNPADATKAQDAPLIAGAAHGFNVQGQVTLGFRLSVNDSATYPNAVALVDYTLGRTVQG